jgi:peptidyl-dipeptidase Dcp
LLDENIKAFRNGANPAEDKKKQNVKLTKNISKTSLQFGENVLAETQALNCAS